MPARIPPIVAALLLTGSCMADATPPAASAQADATAGELSARPVVGGETAGAIGLRPLDLREASALLYVPETLPADRPAPLVVMLHGAGGEARHSLDLARAHADRHGFILLAPGSAAATWDIISGRRYGPDVRAIDAALARVFADHAIDPARVAVAGFSDGASYALSLGLANGDLFRHVIAFSPGFMVPTRQQGRPRIFISHGIADRVLPIDASSRKLAPRLEAAGYDLDYREFAGGHVVPEELADAAFRSVSN